jgi:hypothetical protein
MLVPRQHAVSTLFFLMLAARASPAPAKCDEPHSVDVTVDVQPPDAASQRALERNLAVELRASGMAACSATPADRVLAHVHLRALSPDLARVSIMIEIAAAQLERTVRMLDVSQLPGDARPLAVASAADELLRTALEESRTTARRRARPPRPSPSPAVSRGLPPAEPLPPARPSVELGVAGAGSAFSGQRVAFGADLLGRWWPLPRIAATARLGGARALAESSELGSVRANDVHGALGVGVALVPADATVGLSAQAAFNVMRVSFEVAPVTGAVTRPGNAWALVGSAGVEGWVRTRPLCFSVGLAALVPVVPARATAGTVDVTAVAGVGAEALASVWLLLGAARP